MPHSQLHITLSSLLQYSFKDEHFAWIYVRVRFSWKLASFTEDVIMKIVEP